MQKQIIVCSIPKYDWAAIAAKKESDRLQRFQASGSDAPAPVPCYERGDLP